MTKPEEVHGDTFTLCKQALIDLIDARALKGQIPGRIQTPRMIGSNFKAFVTFIQLED